MRDVIIEALTLIRSTEKTSLTPYQGKADAKGVLTVGTGHVIRKGEEWMLKGITKEQDAEIFAKDVAEHSKYIQADLGPGVILDDWEYGALASFCFNLGARACTEKFAPSVVRGLRSGKPSNGFANLYKFSMSDGKYRDGLFYRRLTEMMLALGKRLVTRPSECNGARSVIAALSRYIPVAVIENYFNSHHVKSLCNTCKSKK